MVGFVVTWMVCIEIKAMKIRFSLSLSLFIYFYLYQQRDFALTNRIKAKQCAGVFTLLLPLCTPYPFFTLCRKATPEKLLL